MLTRSSEMKRSGELKRTGFKRKPLPERAAPVVHRLTRVGVAASITDRVAAQPKEVYVRSPKLREAYRALPCQWPGCGREDGTVVCAHSNWGVHGKGKSIKASDDRGASLCHQHHVAIDQGSQLTEAERKAGWWAAHVSTVAGLVAAGLWPGKVPVPDTSANPFA